MSKSVTVTVPSPKGAVKATGRGLHAVGRVAADANLRSVGRATKSLAGKLRRKSSDSQEN